MTTFSLTISGEIGPNYGGIVDTDTVRQRLQDEIEDVLNTIPMHAESDSFNLQIDETTFYYVANMHVENVSLKG